jgi:5-formyltetrahydrofolate cyclo-ligase
MAAAKEELRRSVRRRRDALAANEAERAAAAAARHFVTLQAVPGGAPALATLSIVALYAAIGSEIDTRPLASQLVRRDIALAYPRVVVGSLRLAFHRVADPSTLTPGSFAIPEPAPDEPIVPLQSIDLAVVPGLAFDERGNRLGWGKGYYDVTLAERPKALRVGFAFECQMVSEVPSGWNDVPMDIIVTEAGVRRCSVPG